MIHFHPLIFTLWTLFLSGLIHTHPQVIHVIPIKNPTYDEEYQCVTEANPEHTKYRWYRQGWDALPEGVKAEGDRLHFLKSTPDLNGLYICTAENELGVAAGSVYRHYRHTDEL
ncbi:hypothetical protein MHYP_G00064130 [Metynnis hypsauchen]